MALCPNCGAQIETDFGMVICSACSSAIFFDMDGTPHLGKHEAVEDSQSFESNAQMQETIIQPAFETSTSQEPEIYIPTEEQSYSSSVRIDENSEMVDSMNLNQESIESSESKAVPEEAIYDSENPEQFEVVETQDSFEESQPTEPLEVDFEQTLDQSMQQQEQASTEPEKSNFKEEIVEFGNSVNVGELTYNLVVSGLDTGDLKNKMFEILSEPKFSLDAQVLKTKIKDGVLVIHNLNSVKASVLVNKLKALQVEIKWSQNAQ